MKYASHEDGEWIRPVMVDYRLACCDCGLVHVLDFRTLDEFGGDEIDGIVEMRATRDKRKTAAMRREMKKRK